MALVADCVGFEVNEEAQEDCVDIKSLLLAAIVDQWNVQMKLALLLKRWVGSIALSTFYLLIAEPGVAVTRTVPSGSVQASKHPSAIAQQPSSNRLLQQQGTLEQGDTVLSDDDSLYDQYTFTGQAGQQVTIVLESGEFDTYLILLDANGNVLAQNDDVNSSTTNSAITLTLPGDGTYTVIANTYDNAGRGQYTLTIDSNESAQTSSQTLDQSVATTVSPCQSAITTAQSQLEEVGNLQVSGSTRDAGYTDHPVDRSQGYVFLMRGSAVESVLRSRVLLANLSTNIIQNCDAIGVVSFGLAGSGWQIPFGLFPNGQIAAFECAEDYGIAPGIGSDQRLRWGVYYCSI